MTLQRNMVLLIAVASTFTVATRAGAATVTVTQFQTANQLSSKDTTLPIINGPGVTYPGPSVAINAGTDQVTFSRGSGSFEIDRADYNYGDTAFPNGTLMLAAGGFQGPGDGGPVTVKFTLPVSQFGVNIEDFNIGTVDLAFSAYNSTSKLLGQFFATGTVPTKLSFEGLSVSGDYISYVVFDDVANSQAVSDPTSAGSNNLIFGNLQFLPDNVALQAPPPAVPEPSTFRQLGLGGLGLLVMGRRLRNRRRQ